MKNIRVGVFYDGGFFSTVSNYYKFEHERNSRLSFDGIHDYIKYHISREEGVPQNKVSIVDSHYFRGRRTIKQLCNIVDPDRLEQTLSNERAFDDAMIRLGIVPHYLPLSSRGDTVVEKGIDVWLALQAFELAVYKRFDVAAFIAGDADFIPLVRKLNALGVEVLIMGWRLGSEESMTETVTTQDLFREAAFPLEMHYLIDNPKDEEHRKAIEGLFVSREDFLSPMEK